MPRVRYWAAARELAGRTEEPVEGGTLAEVLAAVTRAYGPRMGTLLSRSVLLVDGAQVVGGDDPPLGEGSEVEVLPPYAGGAA